MLRNFFSFIWGALGGIIGAVVLIIIGGAFNIAVSWELFVWFGIVGLVGGMIKSFSRIGYGYFAAIVFVIGAVGMLGLSIYAAINVPNVLAGGITDASGEYTITGDIEAIFNPVYYGTIGISGVLILAWYIIIGKGEGGHPFLFTMLVLVLGFVAMFLVERFLGTIYTIVISSVIGGISVIITIVLRIKNGSAIDY